MELELESSIVLFHSFLKKEYPDGTDNIAYALTMFSQSNTKAALILKKNKINPEILLEDFPNLFLDEDGILKANPMANYADKFRGKRIDDVAMKFYTDVLSFDPYLRGQCQDPKTFSSQVTCWKDFERQEGRIHRNCPPRDIVQSLFKTWKLLEIKFKDNQKIFSWREDKQQGSSRRNLSKKDRIRQVANRVRNGRKELEKNQSGIKIDQINFGIESSADSVVRVGTNLTQSVTISCADDDTSHYKVKINANAAKKKKVSVIGPRSFSLSGNDTSNSINVEYIPRSIGVMRCIISFDIEKLNEEGKTSFFSIVRYLDVHCGDPGAAELLKPTSPYERKRRIREQDAFRKPMTIPSEERDNDNVQSQSYVRKLDWYQIPYHWRTTVSDKKAEARLTELYELQDGSIGDSVLCQNLKIKNYFPIFRRLLFLEEMQMEADIKNYDMIDTQFKSKTTHGNLRLHVPGLAESRPSVLKGDIIMVQYSNGNKASYQGEVQRVEMEDCIIKFPHKFQGKYWIGEKVNVRFRLKRSGIRSSHQALRAFNKKSTDHQQILFPQRIKESFPLCMSRYKSGEDLNLFNKDLNSEQRAAVYGVLASVARPIPYLIYGPPGTGKSVTVVESILQVLDASKLGSNVKILVCAPSNAATDLICERLIPYLGTQELVRINAFSRDERGVPRVLRKYCHFSEELNGYTFPPLDTVKKKKVVIMTINSAGKLPNNGLDKHFSHVFVDEAGHAIEAETLSCLIETVIPSKPVVCLAGDPKQLGPIVRSDLAKYFGLEQSFLERLSKRSIYSRNDTSDMDELYDSRVITKLVKNYRSHPSILKLPNELFYDGDLVPCAEHMVSHNLENWVGLPQKKFPLIFHGVEGQDMREGNSPSWYNPDECHMVNAFVTLLVHTKQNRCKPSEIGVVTPYHKQAQKIRQILRKHNFQDVTVGSVEEFQGSERRVIIISTVRSSVEYLNFDNKHKLGFISNSKRFNVAITRAQALLICIGNPYVLECDKNWRSLLNLCRDNGSYIGCDYTPTKNNNNNNGSSSNNHDDIDDEIDETIAGLLKMDIENDEMANDGSFQYTSTKTEQENPEWRFEE